MLLLEDQERQEEVEEGHEAKPVETGNSTHSAIHSKHINYVEAGSEMMEAENNSSEQQISKLVESSIEVEVGGMDDVIGKVMPMSSHQSAGNLHNIKLNEGSEVNGVDSDHISKN